MDSLAMCVHSTQASSPPAYPTSRYPTQTEVSVTYMD